MADLCTVDVHLSGLEDPAGQVVGSLYGPDDDLFHPAPVIATATVDGTTATVRLGPVACGSWALMVYHDRNTNGTLDHRFGFPAEPLAFSNRFALGLFSGLPTFEKLAFPVDGPARLDLVLR